MNLNYTSDFTDAEIAYLKTLSKQELRHHLEQCELASVAAQTNQINRKLLINSCYGA